MVNSIISKILNQEMTNFKNFEVTWPHRFYPRNLQGVLWEERLVQMVEHHTPVEIRKFDRRASS